MLTRTEKLRYSRKNHSIWKGSENYRKFFFSYFSQEFLKIGKIFRKYLKYPKYLIFPKKDKISKKMFFEYFCCLYYKL